MGQARQTWKTVCACLSVCLLQLFPLQAWAAKGGSPAPLSVLDNVEVHYFQRSFDHDPESQRLSRIEKLVFGQQRTGSDSQRLQRLLHDLPAAARGQQPTAIAQGQPAPAVAQKKRVAPSMPGADYPAVDALERTAFGSTYRAQPVSERLARLEKKEFGRVASTPDLAERVDKLTAFMNSKEPSDTADGAAGAIVPFADRHNPGGTTAGAWSAPGPSATASNAGAFGVHGPGMVATVGALEKSVFGKTFPHEKLPERVSALEAKVFGPTAGRRGSLVDRTARLAQAINGSSGYRPALASGGSSLPSEPPVQSAAYGGGADQPAVGRHPILRKIGKGIVAAGTYTGIAALDILGALGSSGVSYGGAGYGMGMPMGPGFGVGVGPMGF